MRVSKIYVSSDPIVLFQNKLESYRSIEKSGKKLTGDQKTAVSKYDECLTSLELTRELCKQFQTIVATANKEAKKEAKRVSGNHLL